MSPFSYIDYVNLLDLSISIANLRSNKTQEASQKLESDFNKKLDLVLDEIHSHLKEQDEKINFIYNKLGGNINDSGRNI